MNEVLITSAGLRQLTEELERLKSDGRREISERLHEAAAAETDALENAEYQRALDEQALLEARISRLEEHLADARVVEPNARNGIVDLGERVRVRDVATGEEAEYQLVGSREADPSSRRISVDSPIGRALLNRRKGEVVAAGTPRGVVQLEILSIRQPKTS